MSRGFRVVLIVGAVLVIIASAIRIATTQTVARAASVTTTAETYKVDRGDVAITVSATGNIQANQSVPLAFTNTGKVTAIYVKSGDFVRKGQTIATIDDQAARQTFVSAQLKINQTQIALDKLMGPPRQVDIDVAQAQLKLAQAQYVESQSGGV
ncbi:MAG TPA: biotin/lipoyl-binding protein, partial [Aggregatilineales bacterium]|nr:biotin/lipoyl-binding protein [Aggregatilineales bacterium]